MDNSAEHQHQHQHQHPENTYVGGSYQIDHQGMVGEDGGMGMTAEELMQGKLRK